MKNEFKNIEELFQQSFDGFEADVDPNVWSNVQNSIDTNVGSSSASSNLTVTSGVAKATIFKIAAGIIAVASIATATYYIADKEVVDEIIISENNIEDNIVDLEEAPVLIGEVKSPEVIVEENKNITVAADFDENTSADNLTEDLPVVSEQSSSPKLEDSPPVNTPPIVVEVGSDADENVEQEEDKKPEIFKEIDAKIFTNVSEGFAPLEVEFNVDGDVVSYAWDFNDGETSSQKNTFHTFNKPGKYVVSLNVLDVNNRDKKITRTIIVKSNFPLSLDPIQNVITPNGDSQNDVFKISGENIFKLEVFIMDNNGNIVYRSNSIDDVWDGKDQRSGNLVIPGTYYLSGVVVGVDGDSRKIQKTITVFK